MSSKMRWPTRERERKVKRTRARMRFGDFIGEVGSVESSRDFAPINVVLPALGERFQRTSTAGI
jgi:hypothetical protein